MNDTVQFHGINSIMEHVACSAVSPISARLPAVRVHLRPPLLQQRVEAQLAGGVVVVELPLRGEGLLHGRAGGAEGLGYSWWIDQV